MSRWPSPPPEPAAEDTTGEVLVILGILAFILGLLSVGLIYMVLMQLNLVGIEPPEPLRYALLLLIPVDSVGCFLLLRRWIGTD